MFYKNVVLYEIYSKILVTEYLLHVSVGSIERKLNWYKLFRVSAVFEIGENFSESHVTITPSWNVEVLIFFNTHNRK
jgi:hypothetical protein